MSLTVGELQVLLSGDPSKLNRDLDRIDSRAGRTERTHTAAWGRIGVAAGAAIRAGMVVATGAVVGLGAAIKQGLDMASFTEQAEISFGTLLGSAEAAKTYLVDLQKFAAATPFELPGVVEGAQKLLGVGAAAETVIPTLTAWGDASGALGLTQEQFGRTLTAVTQMMGKGKVSAEEMLQITEAGIPIWMLLAKATGKPVPELQKLASEGKLLAEDVLPLLEKQMNADYGGSMEKQAKTLSGVWSTAKDNLNLALRDAVLPLASGLKTVLPGASVAAAKAIRELGLRGSEGLVNLIKRGQELREEFGPELGRIAEMASTKWDQFVDVAKRLGAELAPSLPSVADALLRIAEVGMDVGARMLPVLHAAIDAVGPVSEAVAGTLRMVAGALETIEPILPAVVTGFLAFRGISAVNGLLTGFSGGVKSLSDRMSTGAINAGVFTEKITRSAGAGEKVMTGMGKAAGAISRVGSALPVVGLAVAAVGYAFEKHAEQVEADTQALIDNMHAQDQGGQIAINGTKGLEEHRKKIREAEEAYKAAAAATSTSLGATEGYSAGVAIAGTRVERLKENLDKATSAYDAQIAAMTPLEVAQENVTAATNDYLLAVQRHGSDSPQAAAASDVLAAAQGRLEQKQRDLAGATQTATEKLIEQATQAMSAANADLALRQARLGVEEAQARYNAVMADGTATAAERTAAEQALEGSYYSAAQAAAAKAMADNATKSPAEQSAAAVAAQLAVLEEMAATAGGTVPAGVSQLIASLKEGGAATLQAKAQTEAMTTAVSGLGLSVTQVPGQKFVKIDAPTAKQQKQIDDLGYKVVTLPNGEVVVVADTAAAEAAMNWAARKRTSLIEQVVVMQGRQTTGAFAASGGGIEGGRLKHFDAGGAVRGPGGPTSDLVPAMLSNGEHVWTAREVDAAGGQAAVAALRRAVLAGNRAGRQYATAGGGGATGTDRASVAGVTEKHYHLHASVTQKLTPREFVALQREADALYG